MLAEDAIKSAISNYYTKVSILIITIDEENY